MEIEEINEEILKEVYKERKRGDYKGTYGKLLIIGGSKKYSGSPALNALAAYEAGVDIVEVAAVERAANIIANFSPDIITYPLEGEFLNKKHIPILKKLAENKDALVIGGGLGREKKIFKAVIKFLKEINIPCVVDADAIYAFAAEDIKKTNIIFTPHSYEFFILSGKEILNLDLEEKIEIVKEEAKKRKKVILVKGNPDIITDGERVAINETGNPYMTVGGTGDTLAGILGSLIAQKNDLFLAACAAAYINGKAGEISGKKASLVATDLLENIGKVVDSAL